MPFVPSLQPNKILKGTKGKNILQDLFKAGVFLIMHVGDLIPWLLRPNSLV